jgi:hypothetical protein
VVSFDVFERQPAVFSSEEANSFTSLPQQSPAMCLSFALDSFADSGYTFQLILRVDDYDAFHTSARAYVAQFISLTVCKIPLFAHPSHASQIQCDTISLSSAGNLPPGFSKRAISMKTACLSASGTRLMTHLNMMQSAMPTLKANRFDLSLDESRHYLLLLTWHGFLVRGRACPERC